MRNAVIHAWHPFNAPLEGKVPYPYLDCLGLVTTGVGNLIDSKTNAAAGRALALALPWRMPDGSRAPEHIVSQHWEAIRREKSLARYHHRFAKAFFEKTFGFALTLTDEDIDALVDRKLRSNEIELRKHFSQFGQWCADAQLGVLSMAWAMGPDFPRKFPMFSAAAREQRWDLAAARCKIRDGLDTPTRADDNVGVVPRNALNAAHFVEAASDLARTYPEILHGPGRLDVLKTGWKPSLPIRQATARMLAAA